MDMQPPIPSNRPKGAGKRAYTPETASIPATGKNGVRTVSNTTPSHPIHDAQLPTIVEENHTDLSSRNATETTPKPSFFSRLMPWNWGRQNPDSAQALEQKSTAPSTVQSVINLGKKAFRYVNDKASDKSSELFDAVVAKSAGLEVMEAEKKQWGSLLTGIFWNYLDMNGKQPEQNYRFAKLLKTRPGDLPITITDLDFDLTQVTEGPDGVLLQDQKLKNHFKIKHLHCKVEVPVKGDDQPVTCTIDLKNIDLTLASRLGISKLPRILWGNTETCLQDDTVIQMDAEAAEVMFTDAAVSIPLDDRPESLQRPEDGSITGVNSGKITLNKLRIAAPVNVYKQNPDQTIVMSYQSLKFENELAKNRLVEISESEIIHGDDQQSGILSSTLTLHPKMLGKISFTGKCIGWLFPKPINIKVLVPLRDGEVSLKDLKHCVQFSGGSRFLRWLFRKVIKAENTRFVSTDQGVGLQIGWPLVTVVAELGTDDFVPAKPIAQGLSPGSRISNDYITARHRADGYFILSEALSNGLSVAVNENGMDKSRPVRVIPSWLEKTCAEAAKNNNDEPCQELLNYARRCTDSGHDSETMMALQAIPNRFYEKYIQNMSESEWHGVEHQARKLLVVNKEKATCIYHKLLQRKDVQFVGDTSDFNWLVEVAENLPSQTQEDRNLIISSLEFAYKAQPKQAEKALPLLLDMLKKGHYDSARAAGFLKELCSDLPYFQVTERRIELLKSFRTLVPEQVKLELSNFPWKEITNRVRNPGNIKEKIAAESEAHRLKALMTDLGLVTQAADLLIEAGMLDEATTILDRAVKSGHPEALHHRVKYTLKGQITKHTPSSECQLLKRYLSEPDCPQRVKNTATQLLSEIIQRGQNPELARVFYDGVDLSDSKKNSLKHAVEALFSLEDNMFVLPGKLTTLFDRIERELKDALTDNSTIDPHDPSYKQAKENNQQVTVVIELLNHLKEQCQPLISALSQFQEASQVDTDEPSIAAHADVTEFTMFPIADNDNPPVTIAPAITPDDDLMTFTESNDPEEREDEDEIFEDAVEYLTGQHSSLNSLSASNKLQESPLDHDEQLHSVPAKLNDTVRQPDSNTNAIDDLDTLTIPEPEGSKLQLSKKRYHSSFGGRSLYNHPRTRFVDKDLQTAFATASKASLI